MLITKICVSPDLAREIRKSSTIYTSLTIYTLLFPLHDPSRNRSKLLEFNFRLERVVEEDDEDDDEALKVYRDCLQCCNISLSAFVLVPNWTAGSQE